MRPISLAEAKPSEPLSSAPLSVWDEEDVMLLSGATLRVFVAESEEETDGITSGVGEAVIGVTTGVGEGVDGDGRDCATSGVGEAVISVAAGAEASVGDAVTAACIPVPLASDRGKEEPNGLKEKGPVFAVEARDGNPVPATSDWDKEDPNALKEKGLVFGVGARDGFPVSATSDLGRSERKSFNEKITFF